MLFLSSTDFFQHQLFKKNLSGIQSVCQTDWVQIRSDVLFVGVLCWSLFLCPFCFAIILTRKRKLVALLFCLLDVLLL